MKQLVLGVDLGTSAVKVTAIDHQGRIVTQATETYSLQQPQPGYSEQRPEDWVTATTKAIRTILATDGLDTEQIAGISYAGQMHGLVLLDDQQQVLRPAILWNDTRTTDQCVEIKHQLGSKFQQITGNRPLEGFTLPKLLWVKEHEPDIWTRVRTFLLPKDYIRYRMTGKLAIDYSDATGTVLLDIQKGQWSQEICDTFGIPQSICPPLIKSIDFAGNITALYAKFSGLTTETKVFGGAADNAAGAVGAGVLSDNKVLASIGTSGVVLKYENQAETGYDGVLQMEDHAFPDKYYSMGVTLAAGYSLSWFKKTFAKEISFDDLVSEAAQASLGAQGLLFTPYIVGERAPHADATIRGSFIGIDGTQKRSDFTRAVMEGIIFSFQDIMQIYREHHRHFDTVIAIGGGARSAFWLQMQANIFNCRVVSLENEQGPGMGAAMIAATGLGWFTSLAACADQFVHYGPVYQPEKTAVQQYSRLYQIYRQVYDHTNDLTAQLLEFRQN